VLKRCNRSTNVTNAPIAFGRRRNCRNHVNCDEEGNNEDPSCYHRHATGDEFAHRVHVGGEAVCEAPLK
jgi:hypothetical protein